MNWEEKYQMGVERIDSQHRQLFSVARQIYKLFKDGESEKQKFACQEGVKFLKSHLVKHYADEEAYMQEINYTNRVEHKQLHDNMLYHMLPAIEKELEESAYSDESIQKFIGLCLGWLINHIAGEDMAIVGKNISRLGRRQAEHTLKAIEEAIINIVKSNFGNDLEPNVVNEIYGGEYFGKVLCHEVKYDYMLEKRKVFVRVALEEKLIFSICSQFLGSELQAVDETVLGMVEMLSRLMLERLAEVFGLTRNTYVYKDTTFLKRERFGELVRERVQTVSLLFDTKMGMFALCIDDSGKQL